MAQDRRLDASTGASVNPTSASGQYAERPPLTLIYSFREVYK
jgi:hypothetical protein